MESSQGTDEQKKEMLQTETDAPGDSMLPDTQRPGIGNFRPSDPRPINSNRVDRWSDSNAPNRRELDLVGHGDNEPGDSILVETIEEKRERASERPFDSLFQDSSRRIMPVDSPGQSILFDATDHVDAEHTYSRLDDYRISSSYEPSGNKTHEASERGYEDLQLQHDDLYSAADSDGNIDNVIGAHRLSPKFKGTKTEFVHFPRSLPTNLSFKPPETNTTISVTEYENVEPVLGYFSTKSSSGGGKITDYYENQRTKTLYITYEDSEVCRTVSARRHQLAGRRLTIRQQERIPKLPPERTFDARRILLSGLPEKNATKGSILRFMKSIVNKGEHPQVTFGQEPGTAIIAYSTTISNLHDALTRIRRRPFEGQHIEVHEVQMTDTIMVKGFRPGTHDDLIKFTLERQDVDEEVVKNVHKINPSTAMVSFHDVKDVEQILKRSHSLGKVKLSIQPFYECLGVPPEQTTPNSFIVDVSYSIMDFIYASTSHRDQLRHTMSTADAEVIWPHGSNNRNVVIKPRGSHVSVDWKDWEISSRQRFHEFHEKYHRDTFTIPKGMKSFCKEWVTELGAEVKATVREDHNCITLCGVRSEVAESKLQLERLAKDRKAGGVSSTKLQTVTNIKPYQIQLLECCGIMDSLKGNHPNVQINVVPEECTIQFHGSQGDISAARLDMREGFDTLPHRKAEVHLTKIQLLLRAQDRIFKMLQAKNIRATLIHEGANYISIYGNTDADVTKARQFMNEEISIESVRCASSLLMVFRSENGEYFLREINEKYDSCLISFDSEGQCVTIAGFKDDFSHVQEEVLQFMEDNTIKEVSVPMPEGKLQYLDHCLSVQKCVKLPNGVNHQIETDQITLRGKPGDVEKAKNLISNFGFKIVDDYHNVSEPGIQDILKDGKEQVFINHIQTECNCKIDIIDGVQATEGRLPQDLHTVPAQNVPKIKGRYQMSTGQHFLVCHGDITKECVDGLVNAANTRLQHAGGVAHAFVREGGESIQKESNDIVRRRGELSTSMVACTGPGNLPCKVVLHVVGPEYKGGRHREVAHDQLHDAVTNVLQVADKRKLQSIAMPAISSGIYRFPIEKCTETIITSAFDYFTQNEDSTITEVRFTDNDDKACRAFQSTLKFYGTEIVGESDSEDSIGSSRFRSDLQEEELECASYPVHKSPTVTQLSFDTIRTPELKIITIKQGNIANEKVDVIVNTVNVDVGLSHGKVASAILSVAGKALQTECNSNLKLRGGRLRHWEFLKTGHAQLSCTYVYHLSCGNYDGTGGGTIETCFQGAIEELLNRADKDGMRSISLPAIGTGNLGFPPNIVARLMYAAALSFSQQSPNSSLKDVRFVIYQKDFNVVKAFQDEMQNIVMKKSRINPMARQFKGATSSTKVFDDFKVGADGVCRIKVGTIMVLLMNGSIVGAGTDCLVNSTNPQFGLDGPLSQAITKAAGKQMETECQNIGAETLRRELVVKTSAGNMKNAKNIIHILVNQGTDTEFHKKIARALMMADQSNLRSIAFPAIGTGQTSKPVREVAEDLLNAIGTFAISNPKSLNLIKVVIYQPQFFVEYREAMRAVLGRGFNQRRGKFKERMRRLKQMTGFRGSKTCKHTKERVEGGEWGSISFHIFAESEQSLQDAKRRLDDFIREQFTTQELPYKADCIKLTEVRKGRLQEIARRSQTSLDYSMTGTHIRAKRIIVNGRKENILAAMPTLQMQLSEFQHDDTINRQVQWYYKDDDDADNEPYDEDVNPCIEKAHEERRPYIDLELEGGKVRIDFDRKEEVDLNNPHGPVTKVIRRDLTEDDTTRIPDNWDPNKDLEARELSPFSNEYQDVEKRFHAAFTQQKQIISIKHIRNVRLYQEYQLKRSHMLKTLRHLQVERDLYHGTSNDTCEMICKEGFNRSFHGKNATAYGKGTYFARDAKYSASDNYAKPDGNGHKRVFQSKVLTGEFFKGDSSMIAPPVKPSGFRYDCLVDSITNPSIFVIFNDAHAYPEYLITFS